MTDQKREYEDTLSVGKVLKDEFFSNDLTTRLRDFDGINTPTAKLIVEAADRIEELEAVVAWPRHAAKLTCGTVTFGRGGRNKNGQGTFHALWMLGEIENGNITGDKAHRWLGYAQGILVDRDHLTLDQVKKFNKTASGQRARQALEVG